MIDKPLFSIIIPVYNRAHIILKTLQSVFEQSFKSYELIIVDDGSSDNLKDVFDDFVKNNQINNWTYYYKTNGERGAARNFGIQKAKGEYVSFLDSDDLFYLNHLQLAFEFISKARQPNLFHCAYEYVNADTGAIRSVNYGTNPINSSILKGNLVSCFGIFIKREIAIENLFEEDRQLSGSEDWLLWLSLIPKYTFQFQSVITGCMIEHSERSVLNFTSEQLNQRANLLSQKLSSNSNFVSKYGIKTVNKIYAHMLSYGSLHLVLSGKKHQGIRMLLKAIKINFSELLTRRTLAILKNCFRN